MIRVTFCHDSEVVDSLPPSRNALGQHVQLVVTLTEKPVLRPLDCYSGDMLGGRIVHGS